MKIERKIDGPGGLTIGDPELLPGPPRALCTDCGVSRFADHRTCGRVCQFIKPDYERLETRVHGRARATTDISDERFFGIYKRLYKARLKAPKKGAQWTGITTRLGERLLETKAVDAVLTVAPAPEDRWKPIPVLITNAADMASCRGMRMGYAPLLTLLDKAQQRGYRKLAVIGIPCQVYALRELEKDLDLERLYVIGTPCSDNTTTENFRQFLNLLSNQPETITYLEFRADYRVELRFENGNKRTIPFLKLPISKLPADFFPLTCKTCVDYTNSLSDITVGYMAGEGDQWLIVRNNRGEELLSLLDEEVMLSKPRSRGSRKGAVSGFLKNVELASGGLPLRTMPDWLRPIVSFLQPKIGPRGLEFARARVEMKAIESVLHLRQTKAKRMKNMIPAHIWSLVKPYGLQPKEGETKRRQD